MLSFKSRKISHSWVSSCPPGKLFSFSYTSVLKIIKDDVKCCRNLPLSTIKMKIFPQINEFCSLLPITPHNIKSSWSEEELLFFCFSDHQFLPHFLKVISTTSTLNLQKRTVVFLNHLNQRLAFVHKDANLTIKTQTVRQTDGHWSSKCLHHWKIYSLLKQPVKEDTASNLEIIAFFQNQ